MRDSLQVTRYRDWSPTSFDAKGRYMPDGEDYGDWIVAPVSRTRDSNCAYSFYDSNWHVLLERLGGESETVVIHRYGHWGPGWVEIMLVHPSREEAIREVIAELENYPLLDEEDHSNRELEAAEEWWNQGGVKHRLDLIHEYNKQLASWDEPVSIFAARREEIPDDGSGSRSFFEYLTRE